MAFTPSIGILLLGRFIIGVGVGSASLIVPLYLSEVAPIEIRGRLITMNIAMITIGQVLSTVIALLLQPNWRLMLGLSGVPSILQLLGMVFMPESPRWLGKAGRADEQKRVMSLIYKPEHLDTANQLLEKEVLTLKEETKLSVLKRLKSLCTDYSRCLFLGCTIQAFQQLVGPDIAMIYGPDII